MIPEEILNDKEILDIYEQIAKNETGMIGASHGKKHAFNVMKSCEEILKNIGCDEKEIQLGKIAGLLHDIGCCDGKEDHEKNSAIYAMKYLKKKGLVDEDINVVVDAIKNHRNGEEMNSKISAALCFADKIDLSKNRLLEKDKDKNDEFHKNLLFLNKVDLQFGEDKILVNYEVTSQFEPKMIFGWDKAITIPKRIANYLDKEVIFKINGVDSKEYNEYKK